MYAHHLLEGPKGFIDTPDTSHLTIKPACNIPQDPLLADLSPGKPLGCLGMELHSRRRNRVNGTVEAITPDGGIEMRVDQSFGNCPKYIQKRELQLGVPDTGTRQIHSVMRDADSGGGSIVSSALNTASNGALFQAPQGVTATANVSTQEGTVLHPAQRQLIANADTFYIATCNPGLASTTDQILQAIQTGDVVALVMWFVCV